jgi:hypothetical protein
MVSGHAPHGPNRNGRRPQPGEPAEGAQRHHLRQHGVQDGHDRYGRHHACSKTIRSENGESAAAGQQQDQQPTHGESVIEVRIMSYRRHRLAFLCS